MLWIHEFGCLVWPIGFITQVALDTNSCVAVIERTASPLMVSNVLILGVKSNTWGDIPISYQDRKPLALIASQHLPTIVEYISIADFHNTSLSRPIIRAIAAKQSTPTQHLFNRNLKLLIISFLRNMVFSGVSEINHCGFLLLLY